MRSSGRITRRQLLAVSVAAPALCAPRGPRVAITMDDVSWEVIPQPYSKDANSSILGALPKQAALFAVGRNVDNETGRAILTSWAAAGHFIGNHTYSHRMYNQLAPDAFADDVLECERLLSDAPGFQKLFRFPALKEGNTAVKRDFMRAFLHTHGYRNGHVTIDASDWFYDQRLRACLKKDPAFDVTRFRQPYLDHIWDRANYYDSLARRVLRRSVPHTLLIHYNLLNALFLGDLVRMFHEGGWALIDASEAFRDSVFTREPNIVPAGESLVWALAKETGRFDSELRYPGEDDWYERPKLDRLALGAN